MATGMKNGGQNSTGRGRNFSERGGLRLEGELVCKWPSYGGEFFKEIVSSPTEPFGLTLPNRLNANAIAVTTWFLLLMIQSPWLVQDVRRELRNVLLPDDSNNPADVKFDIAGLTSIPLLQGIYKEALRLGSATATARVVSNDIEVDGYILRKGSVVLMPVRVLHFHEKVYDEPEKFDPKRWISSPNESKEGNTAFLQKLKRQNASLRTFGGGSGLCPGRYVAEQEILTSVSMMIMMFDMELERGQAPPRPDPRNLMGMSPIKDPRVKIKRRINPRSAL